jgi:hypothetical protein
MHTFYDKRRVPAFIPLLVAVGVVYDRALFVESTKYAVIDRAHSRNRCASIRCEIVNESGAMFLNSCSCSRSNASICSGASVAPAPRQPRTRLRIIGPPCRIVLAGLAPIDGFADIEVSGIHYLYRGKCALIKRHIRGV